MAAAVILVVFLCSATSTAAAQANYQISLDSSLSPTTNSTWLSPSRTFAFGFYRTLKGYAICIFFANFFEKTVVWTANPDDPVVPDNVVLLLTKDGLVFQESISQIGISSPPIFIVDNSSKPIAGASMLDNGNFVLYNSHGRVSWQTFDLPTNCLVPGQRLSPGAELMSLASEMDLKKGMFRLKMQTDGNLVLYDADSPDVTKGAYYSSGTNGRGDNVSLNLESNGHIYLSDGTSIVLNITMAGRPAKGTFYLIRIDVDGIFREYNRSKGENADCECIPGCDFATPGVWSDGCTCNYKVDCSEKKQSNKYEMRRIQNVAWEDDHYSASSGSGEEQCEEACLNDCSCNVALFIDGECRKQKLPLRYGRWVNSSSDIAFVRVTKSTPGKL